MPRWRQGRAVRCSLGLVLAQVVYIISPSTGSLLPLNGKDGSSHPGLLKRIQKGLRPQLDCGDGRTRRRMHLLCAALAPAPDRPHDLGGAQCAQKRSLVTMLPKDGDSADMLEGKVVGIFKPQPVPQPIPPLTQQDKETIHASLGDVADKAKSQLPNMPVTFSVRPPPGATEVHVIGSWNKWSQDHVMTPSNVADPYGDSGPPAFSCVLELPVGTYHFKFRYRVPGQSVGWMLSQEAEIGKDGDGHENNVVHVDHSLFVTSAPQPVVSHTPSPMPASEEVAPSGTADGGNAALAQTPESVLAEQVILDDVGEWSLKKVASFLVRFVPVLLTAAVIIYGLGKGVLELLGVAPPPNIPTPELAENPPAVAVESAEMVNPLLVGVMLGTCFQMSLLKLMTNPLTAVFGGG